MNNRTKNTYQLSQLNGIFYLLGALSVSQGYLILTLKAYMLYISVL